LIDPMLVILAPPAVVFGWAMTQMHRASKETAEPAPVNVEVRSA
jgi:hypothetical protein